MQEAQAEIAKEDGEKAKKALIDKYRQLSAAKKVVKNIEREIEDLTQSITDGSFTGIR